MKPWEEDWSQPDDAVKPVKPWEEDWQAREKAGLDPGFAIRRNLAIETENPDDAAYDAKRALELGRPRQAIAADRERYRREEMRAELQRMAYESPKTRALMEQPDVFAMARDDLAAIERFEAQTKEKFKGEPTFWKGAGQAGQRLWGALKAGGTQLKTVPAGIELNARTATDQWLDEVDVWEARQKERAVDPVAYDAKFREEWAKQPWFNVWEDQSGKTNIVPNWNRLIGSGKDERPQPPAQAEFMRPLDSLTLQWGGYERMADYYKAERGISQMIAMDLKYRIPLINEEAREQRGERTGNFFIDSALDGVQSIPLTLAALGAGFVTKSPTVSAGIMGGTVYGMEYGEGVTELGLSHETASDRAFWKSSAELAGERLAFGYFFKQLDADNLAAGFAKSMLVEQGQEQVTTVLQDAVDWNYLHPEKTIGEFIAERPERAAQTAIATFVASGTVQGGAFGMQAVLRGPSHQKQQAENTELEKRRNSIFDAARKLKILNRSPERAAGLVDEIVAGSDMETVIVDLDGLKQAFADNTSGLDFNAAVEQLGLSPQQVREAMDAGGEIEVKTSAVITSQIARENSAILDPHVRHPKDDFTPARRKTAASEVEKVLEDAISFTEETVKGGADRLASVQKVRKVLHDRMLKGGAMLKVDKDGEVFRSQHQLMTAMHVTMADAAGMDPMEFTEKHGLQIQRDREEADPEDGETLDQAWKGKRLSGFQDDVERGTEVFHDDRLGKSGSNRNKMAEMARNGYSNDEIGEALGVPVVSVKTTLSIIRDMGIDIPESVSPGQSSETGSASDVLALFAKGVTPRQISERTGKSLGSVQALISQERRRYRERREPLPDWLEPGNKSPYARRDDGLNQADTTDRGRYSLRTRTVHLFESADPSTLMHEASHWYLDQLERIARQKNAPPKIVKMYADILAWYGPRPGFQMYGADGRITPEGVDFQETFAETFEVYLMNGQAPTAELRSAFQTLKQFILQVYRTLTRPQRARLTPDIQAIMDRMLASEDAIEAASRPYIFNAEMQAQALLAKDIITERQYEMAKQRLHSAREDAKEELLALLIGEYIDRRRADYKADERRFRNEEAKTFDESQAGRAWNWLARGAWKGRVQEEKTEAPPFEDADVLAQANASGYGGTDRGEARQWIEAIAKGLDMSTEARMQRARDMGFDTETVFYHGTGDLNNFQNGFDPDLTGLGNDQLGSGFYFTNKPETASGYTTRLLPTGVDKLGGDIAPGVMPVFLRIKNPVILNKGTDLLSNQVRLTVKQAESIIRKSPLLTADLDNNPLGNWHDIWSDGVQDWMIGDVAKGYRGYTILSLENDFFRGHATAFRQAAQEVLGFDGVVQKFDGGEVHKAAWFPEQIRSVHAAFDPDNSDSADLLAQSMPAEAWVDMSKQLREVADAGLGLDPQSWISLIEQMRDATAAGIHTTAETWIARAQAMREAAATTTQASVEAVSDRATQARDMMQAGMDKALEAYARIMAELNTAPHRAHELWNTIRESMDRILYDTLMAVKEFVEVHTNYLRAAIADTVGPLRLRAEAEAAAQAEGRTLNEKALRDAMDQLGNAVSAIQTFLKYEVDLLRMAFSDASDRIAALWGKMADAMNLETLRERGLELAVEVRQGAEQIADVIATHLVETSVAASAAVAASQREIRSAVRGTVLDRMFRKRTPMQTISSDLFDMAPDNASPEFVRRYLDEQAQTTAVALREIAACAAGAVAAPIVTIAAGVTLGSIPGIALGAHILTKDARSEREAEAALKAFRESTSYIEAEKRIKKNMERAALDEQRRQAAKLFFDTFSVESLSADDGFLRNSQVEQYTGIDAGFLDDLISHESGGQYDAKNPDSTATGGGQFIDSTWMNMMRQYGEGAGLDMEVNTANRDAILELRNDPRWATLMTAIYARENAEYMTGRVQRDLTAKDGYLAHFLGVDGAIKAINADASASVEDVMSDSVLKANKNVFYKRDGSPRTMGEFLKYQTRNFTADPLVVNEGWVPMTNLDDGREDRP